MTLTQKFVLVCSGLPLAFHATAVERTQGGNLIDYCSDASAALAVTWEPCYTSELEAVLNAVNRYNPASVRDDREYMGIIYAQIVNGEERFGYTVGAGKPGDDEVTVTMQVPVGSQLKAFWHTHGAHHWSRQYFSATDTRLAREWGMPFYLATAEGLLRVFRPDDPTLGLRQARQLGLGRRAGHGEGQLVHVPDTGQPLLINA